MRQFLITTDIHFSKEFMEEARWFLKWIGCWIPPAFTARYRFGPATHILRTLQEAIEYGPYQGIIDLGDRTHGSPKDRGLDSEHAIQEARDSLRLLLGAFPDVQSQNLHLVPGNHDLGWALSSFTRWGGGYQQTSIARYREVYGSLFGANQLSDNVVLVRIASEPFFFDYKRPDRFKKGERRERVKRRLELLRNELAIQMSFLEETLEGIRQRGQKFILAAHEPSALLSPKLRELLDGPKESPHLDRLLVTLTGHVHARWLMNLINLVRPKLTWIFKRYKIQMIPSVWGVDLPVPGLAWGPGAGWARLTLEEEGGHNTLYVHHTNWRRFRGIRLS